MWLCLMSHILPVVRLCTSILGICFDPLCPVTFVIKPQSNLSIYRSHIEVGLQGHSDGGISVYIPPKSVDLKKFKWLFCSCDPGQIRYDICSRVGH